MVFAEYCFSAFEDSYQVDTIYTDFSKAFDKVSHKILVLKLKKLGFHSAFLNWMESYLRDRLSHVVVESIKYKSFVVTSGVPQGSILGPLLFLLFINDIGSCFHTSNYLLYADDLKIFKKIRHVTDLVDVQNDLNRLNIWCLNNRLALNGKKCFHITFSKLNSNIASSLCTTEGAYSVCCLFVT